VSGAINLTSPQFNISGAISGLNPAGLASPVIDRNPCQGAALGSSLTHSGKGGIPSTESNDVFVSPISFQQSLPDLTLPKKIETSLTPSMKGNNHPCAAILASLVPKLRLGNAVLEAPASRLAKLELR
jgi:hypothetical protein